VRCAVPDRERVVGGPSLSPTLIVPIDKVYLL
jgi:hypothetical protein